ncbi:MAG: hypothetical protein HY931_01215 [Candidatus Falkowbacteria bacterium]|nr:MAG: hypothetical protein HY931_01215 [Candidatus Falkowbacteria bacterium]
MFEEVAIPVKKTNGKENSQSSIEILKLDQENSEQVLTTEINIHKLAYEYNLNDKDKKDLSELIEEINADKEIHSNHLGFYYRDLPVNVMQSPEIQAILKRKLTKALLDNQCIGSISPYITDFGLDKSFFSDQKFDPYRKNLWEKELRHGKKMDFKIGLRKNEFRVIGGEDEEDSDHPLEGNFNHAKALFSQEELKNIGLEGAISAAQGGWLSLGKNEEKMTNFNEYKEEFGLKEADIEKAMIAEIKKTIFEIKIPDELINEYPGVKKFLESPEARELAKEAAFENIALGNDADACLKKFKIDKNEFSQEELIKKTVQNIENNKIKYHFRLDGFCKYIDEKHLPELGEAALKLREELKTDFLDAYFSKAGWSWDKSEGRKNDLDAFKKLNIPSEILVNFAQDIIINKVKGDNYNKEREVKDKENYEFFGVGEKEKQEALSIGYFKYELNRGFYSLNNSEDYTKKQIGLNGFTFTPKFRQLIKETYLSAIKNGDTITLNPINEFLDKENEHIKWEATDRPKLKEAAAEGVINVANQGRDKIKAFADKYYPERHKFFLFNQEYKAKVAEKLVTSIRGTVKLEYSAINRQNLVEAISYFNLDEKDIFNQAEKSTGFLGLYNGQRMAELLPGFNVENHNNRWISEQNPQTVLNLAISENNYELLYALSMHENTKELFEKELANTENRIANTSLFTEQTNGTIEQTRTDLWIMKSSLTRSAIGKGIEKDIDKQIIFSQEEANAALVLKHMSALSPEMRSESAILKLAARKNEKLFVLIKEVMQAAELGVLSVGLEKKLESDFGIQVDNFKENDAINTEKILTEIEKSIEENFDANLISREKLKFDNYTKASTLNNLADTELAVLSGDKKLDNEELFSKIYRKYLSVEEEYRGQFNNKFYALTNQKMLGRDNNFFEEKDWGLALVKYIESVEGERGDQVKQKEQITDLFSGPYRDICLNGMTSDWNKFLKDETWQEIPLRLRVITDTIDKYGGAGNLSRIETFSSIITAVKNAAESEKTTDKTYAEIKNTLQNAETRFEKEKWTQDDKSEFYGLAKDIIEAAPSLFSSLAPVFENMSGKEIKQFIKEVFPLYQAELITMQKIDEKGEITYDARNLVPMKRAIKHLMTDLSAQPEKKEEIITGEKESLITNIRLRFKERFGIVNVPAELNNENFRSVHNLIRYTGNINGRDASSESLISLYLGLQLNGDWDKFRRGEKIEISNYLTPEKAAVIESHLAGREKNSLKPEMVNIKPEELAPFQEKLQAEVTNSMIGNIETIDSKLGNAKRGMEHLLDPDLYDDQGDKNLIPIIKRGDKLVGAVLAKTFQSLKNREIKLSAQEQSLQNNLASALNISNWTEETVKAAQDRVQSISLISKVLNRMEDTKVDENIAELNKRVEPSEDIIKIFNKLDLGFKPSSGAIAISQDLETLASLIVKEGGKLTPEEKENAKKYLDAISEKKAELEGIMRTVKEYFEKIQGSAKANNLKLKDRLKEIREIIYSSGGEKMIVSEMTKDINLIVENMRQCLGCLRKEVNNDTNLAFGDYNKFFMMSREEKTKGSVADEIVFFVPTKKENGESNMSFVMDRVYGSQKPDILISHILTVYKKYQPIKKEFKESNISISISSEAMRSVNIKPEDLQKILKEKIPGLKFNTFVENMKADIPKSSLSDNYIEFGDKGARATGERVFSALVIE